jgi:hypothetical protein
MQMNWFDIGSHLLQTMVFLFLTRPVAQVVRLDVLDRAVCMPTCADTRPSVSMVAA